MPVSPVQFERNAANLRDERVNDAVKQIDIQLSSPIFTEFHDINNDSLVITITSSLTDEEKSIVENKYLAAGWSSVTFELGYSPTNLNVRLKK